MLYRPPAARLGTARLRLSLVRRLVAWLHTRDAIARLAAIDDRLLEDMGIARDDIPQRVRGRRPSR